MIDRIGGTKLNSQKLWCLTFGLILSGLLAAPSAHAGLAIVLQPVSATGGHTIVGPDIYLSAGDQRVKFEIRIAGWDTTPLKIVQVKLDTLGFGFGTPPLTHSMMSCPSNNSAGHSVCAQLFEQGSRCAVGCPPGGTVGCRCESGFQNQMRTDYVGFGVSQISAVDISSPDYRFGLTTQPPDTISDPGTSLYLGTFVLTVPLGAFGTYEVNVDVDETFLWDEFSDPIPIEMRTGCRVIIGAPKIPGSRYVAYEPDEPGEQTAVRVTLSSIYHPGPPVAAGEARDFSSLEGQARWLGPPVTYPDAALNATFVAAPLQCTPHFMDWGAIDRVYAYGDTVIPSSVYEFNQVPVSCEDDPDDPLCFGPTQTLQTGQWGDAAAPFARSDQPSQPDVVDLAEIVDSFRKLADAESKAMTQMGGIVPNPAVDISFRDVDLAVDAVRGKAYPMPVPDSCP